MALRHPFASAVETLPPAVFSTVMATGIVAVAAGQQGFVAAGRALLALAALALVACWVLLILRVSRFPGRVMADLRNPRRAPGFLTTVAGTAVVGSASVSLLGGAGRFAAAMLAIAFCAWIVLSYAVPAALITGADKSGLADAVDGTWLLAVVDTQSISVLASAIAPHAASGLALAATCAWLVGACLYTWVITMVLYRALFLPLRPADLTHGWWINMGAMAISTLAGAQLVAIAPDVPLLAGMQPFIRGGALLCWAVATWWAPLLVVLNLWKYAVRRHPLRYELPQWSAVFPLGMYSVATGRLAAALDLPALATISYAVFWVAALAWLITAVGWLATTTRARNEAPA